MSLGLQAQPRRSTATPKDDVMHWRATVLHIGASLGRQFIAMLLQFLLILIVARALGQDALGGYTIAILVPTLLCQFLNFGLASANVYFIASGKLTAADAWAASRWCVGVIALLGTISAAILIGLIGDRIFPGIPRSILFLSLLLFPIMLTTSVVLSFFQALRDFGAYNRTLLLQPGIAVVGATALALVGWASLETILWVVVAGALTGMGYALFVLSRRVDLAQSGASPLAYLSDVLRFGVTSYAGNCLAMLTYRLDILLVNWFAGPAQAGLYAVAVRLAENLGAVSQASSTVLFPTLAAMKTRRTEQQEFAGAMACGVAIITFVAASLAGLVASPLVALLFGEAFTSAVPTFLILLPGTVALSVSRVLANDSVARGRPGLNLRLAGVALVINTLANVALIPRFGISGAAMASTLAYSIDCGIRIHLLRASGDPPRGEIRYGSRA